MLLSTLVGSKITKLIVAVLAATLTLFLMIQYIQFQAKQDLSREIQLETQQFQEDLLNEVQDALQQNQENNPGRDASIALDSLRRRQAD